MTSIRERWVIRLSMNLIVLRLRSLMMYLSLPYKMHDLLSLLWFFKETLVTFFVTTTPPHHRTFGCCIRTTPLLSCLSCTLPCASPARFFHKAALNRFAHNSVIKRWALLKSINFQHFWRHYVVFPLRLIFPRNCKHIVPSVCS